MKKGGQPLLEYMKKVIDDSNLTDKPQPELDASVDFLQAYRLVDSRKIDAYARAFIVEDDNKTGVIKYQVLNSLYCKTKNPIKTFIKLINIIIIIILGGFAVVGMVQSEN